MSRSVVLPIAVTATTILGLGFAAAFVDPSAVVFFGAYAGIGAYLVVRRPSNPIGWLLMLTGWGLVVGNVPVTASLDALQAGTEAPAQAAAAWANGCGWILVMTGIFGLALVFPTGHLPEGRGRRWSQIAIVAVVVVAGVLAIGPTTNVIFASDGSSATVPNPIGVARDAPWWRLAPDPGILFMSLFLLIVASVVGLIRRYRRATGLERLQYRWLVAALVLVAFGTLAWAIATQALGFDSHGLAWLPIVIAYPTVPVAVAIAILRYRLYELDRIISRTIAYAAVSAILVGVFAAGVIVLSAALSTFAQGQTLAVAGSTLLTYAVLQPVLRSVRRTVDRRFDRARYDADRTALGFSDRLRHETDMEAVMTDLAQTTRSAVAPASLTLWFRDRGASR
jgi:hypothetical protein